MKLGLSMGYVVGGNVHDCLELAKEADRLGFSVAWAAEAYGSDSPTVLSYVAAHTESIDVGAAVMQIPARTPAATAMTAATLDLLSGGRFRLGLGVSGPQVSEGWHGVPFGKPLVRTREYVAIVNQALSRATVSYDGEFFRLPLPGGSGKPLKLNLHPRRDHIPMYLAAVGPKNLELAGEIADGWLAIFYSPAYAQEANERLRAGQQRTGRDGSGFDVCATVPVSFGADLETCAAPIRHYTALYVGGMGSRSQNFYNQLACRMGFEAAAKRIQDLYLDREYQQAAAAVPLELVDQTALIGPPARVAERMQAFAESGVTTLTVSTFGRDLAERVDTLRRVAETFDASGLGN